MFSHRSLFRRHMKRHAERNLKCSHCDKCFIRRLQLFNHMAMHTKIKPFKCAMCHTYSSERKGNVAIHVKKIHKQSWSNSDILVDSQALQMMNKIARTQVEKIMKVREK